MTSKEQAELFDKQEHPVEAAEAYEKAITESGADLETYLNLAVLYFVCTDGGYLAHHHLSDEFVSRAWERSIELLKDAESKFGWHSEIAFWQHYFPCARLGEPPFVDECEQLVKSNTSLVPYFYLFTAYLLASSSTEKYRKEAQQLLDLVKDGATEKRRYILSILEYWLNVTDAPRP